MEILFVCTGNTCRSPLAEAILKRVLAEKGIGGVKVSSAGLNAPAGSPASEGAKGVLQAGEDLSAHLARQVDETMLAKADLVLAMTSKHKSILQAQFPSFSERINTLGEAAWEKEMDVADPYGGSQPEYQTARAQIEAALLQLAPKIIDLKRGSAMKIALASDHGGFVLKEEMKALVQALGYQYVDFGCNSETAVDYPDYAGAAARAVAAGQCQLGVIVCGTGLGMAIAANKVKGIRAVNCQDCYTAAMARAHNDANILSLGGRVVGLELAKMIAKTFLTGAFEGGRHVNRLEKIAALEEEFGR